ncbi:hypothetical protein CQ010_06245 [Arthrobacter sp. MYb211]|uniref:hypothetical protein n=1 Tax=unclassified Arthrobacter TaxID=235627 RepID=UPI000CFE0392|nr:MULTISPECIES: hypothetical protein [unclassified Arthrobacter]PRA04517.1 hypothetical protein CQ019_09345 [Arthrobacter sp. MYb229]PRA12250.1 hypothetical protein CQ015_06940 [Arthrobacter sp. MYb221]PRB51570.1 hypothetical protein CQ013_07220 [Arthrobacter sp. MYb216]PRC08712.1 hypothetical protein CQ010_06245 [Arthrobacter sp. MYb211]
MTIRLHPVLLKASAAALIACLSAAPVHARSDQDSAGGLSYSSDGRNFSQAPPPLFGGEPVLVPGDEVIGALWIRNDRGLEIEVSVQPKDPAAHTQIYFETIGLSRFRLEPEESVKVGLRMGMPGSATNGSQDQEERSLQVQINAVEIGIGKTPEPEPSQPPRETDAPPEAPPEKNTPDQRDQLSDTGFSGGVIALGIGALAAGCAAVILSWRQKRTEAIRDDGKR